MADPLGAFDIEVVNGAERSRIEGVLGPLVNDRSNLPTEGSSRAVGLDEVLLNLGPNGLGKVP